MELKPCPFCGSEPDCNNSGFMKAGNNTFLCRRQDMEAVTLWQGDCLELMKNIPNGSVDMILCDLPYKETGNK